MVFTNCGYDYKMVMSEVYNCFIQQLQRIFVNAVPSKIWCTHRDIIQVQFNQRKGRLGILWHATTGNFSFFSKMKHFEEFWSEIFASVRKVEALAHFITGEGTTAVLLSSDEAIDVASNKHKTITMQASVHCMDIFLVKTVY